MLKPEECILVVVDVQGQLARIVEQSEQLHQKLAQLIKGAQLFELPILWLEQLPDKLGATSTELALELNKTTTPITKQHFSGWQANEFRTRLNDLTQKHIILAGIETHICVYQTCRDLLENDYQVHLVIDAVSSRQATNKTCGIEMMQANGAVQTNVESLLFELQQQAKGERFKTLLKLIK